MLDFPCITQLFIKAQQNALLSNLVISLLYIIFLYVATYFSHHRENKISEKTRKNTQV